MAYTYVESNLSEVISGIERSSVFGIDLETTGLSPIDSRVILCQIGIPDQQWVINTAKVKIEPLIKYLTSHKWKKIIQNSKFEQKFFQYFYDAKIENVWDTFLAEKIISPDERTGSGLAALTLKYTGKTRDKEIRKSFVGKGDATFSEKQLLYAAEDVEDLFAIMEGQRTKGEELGLIPVFELEFELAGVVADMELAGVPVNADLWRSKIKHFEEEHEKSRLRLHEILFDDNNLDEQMGLFVRDGINLNSTKKLKEAFQKIGIDVDSTNEREISLVNHPAARELLEYRGLQKILSSYGTSFLDKIHPFTGRIHADFMQLGTETGRFSCKDPNLQQMPAEFRTCIQDTKDEYVIVGADYANIELRILAELSGDESLKKAFNTGDDPHKSTASLMFGISIDRVSKEQRFIAKTINFGIAYGMGTKKLMDMLNSEARKNKTPDMAFPQVAKMMSMYNATYRKATGWLSDAGNRAFRQGYSETMYGRKRFYTRPDPNAWPEREYENQVAAIKRKGANSPIQGTNADITKIAMINLYTELKDAGYRANIAIQVHDEIVLVARKEQAEAVKVVVEEVMNRAATTLIKSVPIKSDAYISTQWKK